MRVVEEYNLLDEKQREAHDRIDRALSDGALMVQNTAMSIVAVDTGRLRASITLERVGNMLYEVFTIVEYAGYVEYGTIYMNAQPYFRPAYERNYQLIIAMLAKELATL